MTNSKFPFVLVDGSSYLYRAFFACPPLTNVNGEPTGAIFGVINMLKSFILEYRPKYIAIIFDAKGKTFRDEIFSEYKAHREKMPEDLVKQIEPLYKLLTSMGIPPIIVENVEADDVIGTLAINASKENIPVLISTGDKDMAQLIDENITLINTMTNSILNHQNMHEKYSFSPNLMIDYLALMGDQSDNIPGVPGIGEKTAKVLLNHFPGIHSIYKNLEKIADLPIRGAKSIQKKLKENHDLAKISYKLATIKTDLKLDFEMEDCLPKMPDFDALKTQFRALNFSRLLKEIEEDRFFIMDLLDENISDLTENSSEKEQTLIKKEVNYQLIDEKSLGYWLDKLKATKIFAFDTETDSLNYMQANLVGMSFSLKSGEAAYLPLRIQNYNVENFDEILAKIKPILEDPAIQKIGQHIKFDMNILALYGIKIENAAFDTMLEAYVLNSLGRHDMNTLAQKYLARETISFESIAGKGKKQITFDWVDLDFAKNYAAEDADITFQLHQTLFDLLKKTPSLLKIYQDFEAPLIPILSKIEQNGVLIDPFLLKKQSNEIEKKLAELEKKSFLIAGENFNLASPKQIQTIFYEKLQLPILKKTPKGAPSTDEETLFELAKNYELPRVLLEHRGLAKLKNTYTDKLPELIDPKTNRLHTSYHQAITSTGRLSSSDPNLQNIPVKNEEGRRIREAFIAPENYLLIAADYSQIELRIMAHLSNDENLLEAFTQNKDIHRATAAEVLGILEENVSDEQRRNAKAINFGLIYGMSAFGLSRQLNISRQDAQNYMDRYFEQYPGVLNYMEKTRNFAKENGFVETISGRRLYLPEINSSNAIQRKAAERIAINAPMQGTAADIIKLAMIEIDRFIQKNQDNSLKMIMQVHDELIFEAPKDKIDFLAKIIQEKMENCFKLAIPLKVDVNIGKNWGDAS